MFGWLAPWTYWRSSRLLDRRMRSFATSGSAGARTRTRAGLDGNGANGQLVGGIVFTGLATHHGYQPGLVRVTRHGHVVARRRVRRHQLYRLRLAPGSYGIDAQTKRGDCTGSASIQTGHTTHANAYCVFH